jgi:hypothetical protein
MDGVLARAALASGIARLLWWRPRAISACDAGLVIEYASRTETIAWAEIDAVIDVEPVLVQSRGRVIARIHTDEDDAIASVIAAIVTRAGLEWIDAARKRKLPRMAVRPSVAARLR